MFRVLIVDDSERKRQRIRAVIEPLGGGSVEVGEAANVHAAIAALESTVFDLVVVDIHLPLRQDDQPRKDGGRILLETVFKQGARLKRPRKIVGLTGFEEIHAGLTEAFAAKGVQLILSSDESEEWAIVLTNIVSYDMGIETGSDGAYEVDVCIVTALKEVELQAVLALPGDWHSEPIAGDDTVYFRGAFVRGVKRRSVIAAAAVEMGIPAAASLAMKMVYTFRPRYLCMCGITAGVGFRCGDVIIADQCWDYGSGKFVTDDDGSVRFEAAPKYVSMSDNIKERIGVFIATKQENIAGIHGRWQGNPIENALRIALAPMASGAAVVENREVVSAIKTHNRKVAAIEMEAYGIFMAGRLSSRPRPEVVVAKSVCDVGVPPKTDEFQRYAAFTSSQVLYELLLECLP